MFVVADQTLTPTYARDLAESVRALLGAEVNGTVHVTGGGQCSWYEFAADIVRLAGYSTPITPVMQRDRPTPARRPAYSVLAHDTLLRVGIPEPRHWREALREYLTCRGQGV